MFKCDSIPDFIPHSWIADDVDTWRCACCNWQTTRDTDLNDDELCEACAEEKAQEAAEL